MTEAKIIAQTYVCPSVWAGLGSITQQFIKRYTPSPVRKLAQICSPIQTIRPPPYRFRLKPSKP